MRGDGSPARFPPPGTIFCRRLTLRRFAAIEHFVLSRREVGSARQNRDPVAADRISSAMKAAIEDRRFYRHQGMAGETGNP
jgi:hypothetical protein